jgi:hypothetical protein
MCAAAQVSDIPILARAEISYYYGRRPVDATPLPGVCAYLALDKKQKTFLQGNASLQCSQVIKARSLLTSGYWE